MMPNQFHVALLVSVMVMPECSSVAVGSQEQQLGVTVGQLMMEQRLNRCHLMLATTTGRSLVLPSMLRHVKANVYGVALVESGSFFSQEQVAQDDFLLKGMWGDARTTCRALLLDLTNNNDMNSTYLALSLLEKSKLWQLPETRVVVVGGRAGVEAVLLHPSLRNTLHALYLAIQDLSLYTQLRHDSQLFKRAVLNQVAPFDRVWVYQRCMYCNKSEAGFQFQQTWNLRSEAQSYDNVFREQQRDLMGHTFRIVSVSRFPYVDFHRDTEMPGTTVTMKDSLDARMIGTLSKALNFTYDIREEPERTWGMEKEEGVFNGMVGQLQRGEADFSTSLGPTTQRLKVIQYLKVYPSDLLTITSLKPSLLPQHLALIRPFAGEVWLALLVSVAAWGVLLWLLQKAWWWVAGGREVRFNTALLYGWGALLERPPSDPSVNISGQVLLGWWLIFCLVVAVAYRSSLIAHLTVQKKSQPLETFEDLVKQEGWGWCLEPWFFKGIPFNYFTKHTDPVVKKINKKMELILLDDALKKVLKGSFSLIHWKRYITIIVASYYTDAYGRSPFYISNKGISIMAAAGWGIREGASFQLRFYQLMNRLEDAGIISYWTEDVIAGRVRDNRQAAKLDPQVTREVVSQVKLGLQHTQGAFYILMLGCVVALLLLLAENLSRSRNISKKSSFYHD